MRSDVYVALSSTKAGGHVTAHLFLLAKGLKVQGALIRAKEQVIILVMLWLLARL